MAFNAKNEMTGRPIDRLMLQVADCSLDRDKVIGALFLLRAHRSLQGIGLAIDHFLRLHERFPELASVPGIDDIAGRLAVLRKIADATRADPEYNGKRIASRSPAKQLKPDCGDSAITDILLVWHGADRSSDDDDFDRLVSWFIWNALVFNVRKLSLADYKKYLNSEQNEFRLLGGTIASAKLYTAGLRVRDLGDPDQRSALTRAVSLDLRFDPEVVRSLTLQLRVAGLRSGPGRERTVQEARRQPGFDDGDFFRRVSEVQGIFDPAVALFLVATWWPRLLEPTAGTPRSVDRRSSPQRLMPSLRRAPFLTEVVTSVEEGIQSGVAIDFVPTPRRKLEIEADEDPDTAETLEPSFSVFLSDQEDLVKGFYAAKGIQSSIEYANAMLPWAHWRLSQSAVSTILGVVIAEAAEPPAEQAARLSIGLSLVCGRPLNAVALPLLSENWVVPTVKHPVVVHIESATVMILAATPELKKPASQQLCDPHGEYLSLALPDSWRPLLRRCANLNLRKRPPVLTAARKMLRALPVELDVTEKGLRTRLAIELLRLGKGDLGLVKLITDAGDANLENIIHYASYRAVTAQQMWREAIEAIIKAPLPELEIATNPDERVGSPHAFSVDKLRSYFALQRKRFEEQLAMENWAEVFNGLTLRTAQMLALDTAGRATSSPIPRIFLAGDWILVDDKHRSDGSTDRVCRLSDSTKQQLLAYSAFASNLAISDPRLEPFVRTDDRWELRLLVVENGKVRPYRPHFQAQVKECEPLPGNWARKLVRAEGDTVFGRMIDAVSGHAVRGRHSWRYTSTLDVSAFDASWGRLRADLEARLGLTVLTVPGFERTRRAFAPRLPPAGRQSKSAEPPVPPTGPSDAEIDDRLRQVEMQLYTAVFNSEIPDKYAALDLVCRLLRDLAASLAPDELLEWAEAVCRFIRTKKGIPLFAARPRPRFSRDWMLDATALQTLAWFEHYVLDRFEADIVCLPPHATEPDLSEAAPKEWMPRTGRSARQEGGNGDEASAMVEIQPQSSDGGSKAKKKRRPAINRFDHPDIAELGRLIMIAVWRIGLTRQPILEVFLRWFASDEPILATGSLRYVVLQVACSRTGLLMGRTVIFDDFSTCYLLLERVRLRKVIEQIFGLRRERRQTRWYDAVAPYLALIGAPRGSSMTLPRMMAAAVQRLMLDSSPLLAAYSCGEFATEDLDDRELRRLAGLQPHRDRSEPGRASTLKLSTQDDSDSLDDDRESELPKDLRDGRHNFVHALIEHRTPIFRQLLRDVEKVKAETRTEKLIKAFALSLLELESSGVEKGNIKAKRRMLWKRRVSVVGYALTGMCESEGDLGHLDEADIERLSESSCEHFPEKVVHGAWFKFKAFLRDNDADHAGVEVGYLGNNTEHHVSAKIVPAKVLQQIEGILPSVRAGIAKQELRGAALRLFQFLVDTGARRAEAQHLRVIDAQGDLIRVQAYDQHTLKTAWSERVIPVSFLSPSTQAWVRGSKAKGQQQIISLDGHAVAGHNVFGSLNESLKKYGRDDGLGLHHLRHTMASRLMLSVMREAVNLDGVSNDLGWIEPLLIGGERLETLLGYEGPSGHGLQAISGLIGHSHPTTTLTHYIHVLGILIYAFRMKRESHQNIGRCFEKRVRSEKTVERWITGARAETADITDSLQRQSRINRILRDNIEAIASERSHVDERPMSDIDDEVDGAGTNERQDHGSGGKRVTKLLSFSRIEAIDTALRGDPLGFKDSLLKRALVGLERLSRIPTGKKGSSQPRHPLMRNSYGVPLPEPLATDSASDAAIALLRYLDALRVSRREDFRWLLQKWTYASESERGRMRLDTEHECERARALPADSKFNFEIEQARVSKRRVSANTNPIWRLRIRYVGQSHYDRDILAIRWVFTWLAALSLSISSSDS